MLPEITHLPHLSSNLLTTQGLGPNHFSCETLSVDSMVEIVIYICCSRNVHSEELLVRCGDQKWLVASPMSSTCVQTASQQFCTHSKN